MRRALQCGYLGPVARTGRLRPTGQPALGRLCSALAHLRSPGRSASLAGGTRALSWRGCLSCGSRLACSCVAGAAAVGLDFGLQAAARLLRAPGTPLALSLAGLQAQCRGQRQQRRLKAMGLATSQAQVAQRLGPRCQPLAAPWAMLPRAPVQVQGASSVPAGPRATCLPRAPLEAPQDWVTLVPKMLGTVLKVLSGLKLRPWPLPGQPSSWQPPAWPLRSPLAGTTLPGREPVGKRP